MGTNGVTKFYCTKTVMVAGSSKTKVVVTKEPQRCTGYINARKLCTSCKCNANGASPSLVFERMHGEQNVCYCKGEERTTIPEPCAGPLPRDTDLNGEKPMSSVYRHWKAHANLHGAT